MSRELSWEEIQGKPIRHFDNLEVIKTSDHPGIGVV